MLLRPTSLALFTALALAAGPAVAVADSSPTPIAAERVSTATLAADHATPTAPTTDAKAASTYAQRETTSKDAAKFNGGSVVVIGASGGALLVILIILLILV